MEQYQPNDYRSKVDSMFSGHNTTHAISTRGREGGREEGGRERGRERERERERERRKREGGCYQYL